MSYHNSVRERGTSTEDQLLRVLVHGLGLRTCNEWKESTPLLRLTSLIKPAEFPQLATGAAAAAADVGCGGGVERQGW